MHPVDPLEGQAAGVSALAPRGACAVEHSPALRPETPSGTRGENLEGRHMARARNKNMGPTRGRMKARKMGMGSGKSRKKPATKRRV